MDPNDELVEGMLQEEGFTVEHQSKHIFFVILEGRQLDESDFRQHIEDALKEVGSKLKVTARRTNYNSFIVQLK